MKTDQLWKRRRNNDGEYVYNSISSLKDLEYDFGTFIKEDGIHIYNEEFYRFIPNKENCKYERFIISPDLQRMSYNIYLKDPRYKFGLLIGSNEISLIPNGIDHDSVNVKEIITQNIYHDFRITIDNTQNSQIAYHYFKDKENCILIKNLFDDDDSINLQIREYQKNILQFDFLTLHLHSNKYNCSGLSIYGIPVSQILSIVETSMSFQHCQKLPEKYRYTQQQIDNCIEIFRLVQNKLKLDAKQTAQYLYDQYCDHLNIDLVKMNRGFKKYSNDYQKALEKNRNLYREMVTNQSLPIRWKSEYELFLLIKKEFTDAIYQYRNSKLLNLQSFDIFIPSKKIAFEFQGIQHYEPISFFGGEEAFNHRKNLDLQKKKICETNNIKLIYWKYDEPISKIILNNKLAGINQQENAD